MKEISVEEKVKAYDEAIKVAKSKIKNDKDHVLYEEDITDIFPELKVESEDERIRSEIISAIKEDWPGHTDWITWLEKQDEKKPTKEHNVCDFCEEKHECVNPCPTKLIEEQKPADKVEPKFKFGDRVRNKKSDLEQTLGSCIEDVYEGAFPFRIKDQDDWELVEQKSAEWSKEDELKLNQAIYVCHQNGYVNVTAEALNQFTLRLL